MRRARWPLAGIGATAIVVGCATLGPPGAADLEDGAVAYAFEFRPGALRVVLRVRGESSGVSRLAIAPSWGGVENCERFVHDLSVVDAAGRPCSVAVDPSAPHGWNVSHEPGTTLEASYEVRPADPDPLAKFGTHYAPVVRDDLVHLIGETGLLYPEWLEEEGPIDIRVSFAGYRERGWTIATSFDAEGESLRRTLRDFRHAIFLAGRLRVHDRDLRGGRLRVAIFGEGWPFEDAELVDLVERIVAVEREFVGDFDDPYFLVTVVAAGPPVNPQSVSMGGAGLTNAFALFLAPGTTAGPGTPHRAHLLRLLAHEYFHAWNGGEILPEEPEELAYWFSEGFTDFYASRLLRRAGLIDDAEWTDRMNETLRRLWLNPAATEPAETIRRSFWASRDVGALPYQRGEVVALMLDEEIRRVCGGRRSLDDFFLEVLADARRGEKSQTDRLLARVARWTRPDFAETLRAIVVDGALPDPPGRLTEPGAVRMDSEGHRYDPGYDVEASLEAKVAVGVREGGPAHVAGLREGQPIDGFSIPRGDPEREIRLDVRDDDGTRAIAFFPRGEPVRIPSYRLALDVADLFDLARLVEPRPWRVRQFSSFDRSGGNDDAGHFLEEEEGGRALLARADGAGALLRLWSANPDGEPDRPARLRIADGGRTILERPFGEIFDAAAAPFLPPLAQRSSGGAISYVPIPYRDGLTVETERAGRLYYQVEVLELPPGTEARSGDESIARIEAALARAARGENPTPASPSPAIVCETKESTPAGVETTLYSREGQGTVEELSISLGAGADLGSLRDLFLRVWVDGARRAAVDAPFDLFFCTPFGVRDTTAYPIAVRGRRFTCFFRIPFTKGIRIALAARRGIPGPISSLVRVRDGDPGTPLRFHARFSRATTEAGRPFSILDATGRGHFVGVSAAFCGTEEIGFLEGDEEVWVDGEKHFQGTGTEDYFNSGWYFAGGPVQQPFHGCTVREGERARIGAHRFHVSDAIPFERSFRMTLEHGGRDDHPGAGYAAVATAYLETPEGAPPLEGEPRPLVTAPLADDALDARALLEARIEGAGAIEPLPVEDVLRPHLILEGGVGRLRIRAKEAGAFRIEGGYRTIPEGESVEATLDGGSVGAWEGAAGSAVWLSEPLHLSAGEHVLELRAEGAGVRVAVQFLRLRNLIEGEGHLPLAGGRFGGGSPVRQSIAWDPRREGTAQLWFRDAGPGAWFEIEVPVAVGATYRIGGRFTRAPDYAILRLLVDGAPLGEPWDAYAPAVEVAEAWFGERRLEAGVHRFAFEIVDRNPAARGIWMIGLDRLLLDRTEGENR